MRQSALYLSVKAPGRHYRAGAACRNHSAESMMNLCIISPNRKAGRRIVMVVSEHDSLYHAVFLNCKLFLTKCKNSLTTHSVYEIHESMRTRRKPLQILADKVGRAQLSVMLGVDLSTIYLWIYREKDPKREAGRRPSIKNMHSLVSIAGREKINGLTIEYLAKL